MDLWFFLCYIIFVANNGVWLSLVERFVRDEEVACSNLVTPTIKTADRWTGGFLFFSLRSPELCCIRSLPQLLPCTSKSPPF